LGNDLDLAVVADGTGGGDVDPDHRGDRLDEGGADFLGGSTPEGRSARTSSTEVSGMAESAIQSEGVRWVRVVTCGRWTTQVPRSQPETSVVPVMVRNVQYRGGISRVARKALDVKPLVEVRSDHVVRPRNEKIGSRIAWTTGSPSQHTVVHGQVRDTCLLTDSRPAGSLAPAAPADACT
jgi:hypothetical protein